MAVQRLFQRNKNKSAAGRFYYDGIRIFILRGGYRMGHFKKFAYGSVPPDKWPVAYFHTLERNGNGAAPFYCAARDSVSYRFFFTFITE